MAGIGCCRAIAADEIIALIETAMLEAALPRVSLLAIGTHERKSVEPGLRAAAAYFDVPLRILADAELEPVAVHLPVTRAGVAAVAEAVALTAGDLVLGKRKSAGATCALGAVRPGFDLTNFGRSAQAPTSSAAIAASMSATSLAGP
ncbi:hypothetical protein VW29_06530 [Devosia limi DSM 17137]|uniref:CobE/GbiG C-terminal domain-containing protein n=1 Tax=Devosia limi DSM 17137 TaxID=1121477 RepID=A0A0F5LU01_9HYPH|nr:hypothetical protein VW29_06530 [Devosia limi DSM 17137]